MKLYALPTIFVDFETFWSSDYTLSKMPTQAYIQDKRFKAHGCCVAVNDGKIVWVPHEKLSAFFISLHTKYPRAIWVFHNALFDATILAIIYNTHPFLIADTAGISRALVGPLLRKHGLKDVGQFLAQMEKGKELIKSLGIWDLREAGIEEEIAGYCAKDVEIMRACYKLMCPHFPGSELLVMTWVTQMMTQPKLMLDEQMLWDYHHEVANRKIKLLEELGVDKKDLMSNDKFATLLCNYGVVPPKKISARTGKEAYAFAKTDQGLKDLLEHDNEDVQSLVAARLEVKTTIEETRSKTFAQLAAFGAVSVPLAYSGAINTHRLSGRDKLNWQNLKRGGVIRNAVYAPEGYELIVSDLSQIELRLTLWLAGHFGEVEFLASGGDIYSEVASELYGVEVTKEKAKTDEQIAQMRHVGKSTVLGSGFGMGAQKYQSWLATQGINVTSDFAKAAIKLFRTKFSGVPELWRKMELYFLTLLERQVPVAAQLGTYIIELGFDPIFASPSVKLPNGLYIKYPKLTIKDQQWSYQNGGEEVKIFGGHFLENTCQSLARCIMMDKSVEVHRRYPVCMSTHDELVALVPEREVEEVKQWVHSTMIKEVSWIPGLPLGADTTSAVRYGDAK